MSYAQDAGDRGLAADQGRQESKDRLFDDLAAATDERAARLIEERIWRHWMHAPDARTQQLVEAAMKSRGSYDFAGARELLDHAITRSPDYAEAWNQRGFVRFLQEDFDAALEDVDKAIALEPRHFAAMAGRALILMRQGRHRLAQAQLREAVAIHPFLRERSLLAAEPANPRDEAPEGIDL
ncbi:tetratricopeptide repeat protein [Jiella marina]|uniref:tetratricopeptide repeat protein n=1 Tax=Jiella sp. LLJ827 TaxID=2917712 RepID=UPI002101A3F3|nr:tetratricopeptide repeat protein [Jiella sp. LLJ827]